jgi:hypothetical protein
VEKEEFEVMNNCANLSHVLSFSLSTLLIL